MHRSSVLALSLCLLLTPTVASADAQTDQYYEDTATFFADSTEAIADVLALEPDAEDVPVIFSLAHLAKTSPQRIAKLRTRGDGWHGIMKARNVQPRDLYFLIASEVESPVFSPIFEKFSATAESNWGTIEFTDEDIVNLVNLRFIYRHHGYSVFEVMAMRDNGKSFPAINQAIASLKHELNQEEKAKRREAQEKASKEAEG